uniref:WD repeat-containing protein 3 n=1 Tax=Lygus hesperus TaxID=30085 RepID=A0A146MA61_LYGHE
MGLTKQYLRYVPAGTFNLIASIGCNVCFVTYQGQEGRFVACGACDYIVIWDLRLGNQALKIPLEVHSEVTHLCPSPDGVHLAAGLSNGSVHVYNLITGEQKAVFAGHRNAISCLAFDSDAHRLASGSKDTEIVIWDLIDERGLERLTGHKNVVTALTFLKNSNVLISSSKDTYIKFWDLDTSHCFNTIAAHVTEVWTLSMIGNDEFIVAGSNDSSLMVWSLHGPDSHDSSFETESLDDSVSAKKCGSVLREGRGRVVSVAVDNTGRTLTVHGTDSKVEVFEFLNKEDAAARSKKRCAKERKKALKLGTKTELKEEISLKDVVRKLGTFVCSDKVKSVSVVTGSAELRVSVSLANNSLELYSLKQSDSVSNKPVLFDPLRKFVQPGHQGEVRAVSFSSDNLAIATAGANSIKIWNRVSLMCLRTVVTDYALCICFVPGDRHVIVGLKSGSVLVVDVSSGEILETIPAHTAEVWSIARTHDDTGIITASGDSTIKVWKFELVSVEGSKAKVLSILHTRTLKVDEPILCARISPCGKLIAASLLDSTTKIFFFDSFKFFVSLYGHKMPVLASDISYDSTLIVTGSADRSIKIWGLDFGDCHKSLFAHDDSVTAVQFVPQTHYFFSCGKDGKVKQWDADTFNKIITLEGHFGECWNLSVGGDFVVSCGKDRVLRLYEKTEEPLVLEDEAEEEREKEELATGQDSIAKLPSVKTVTAERGAESLMECVDVLTKYKEVVMSGNKPEIPPIMRALGVKTPSDYLAKSLASIKPSEVGESLLLLSFHHVTFILEMLPRLLSCPNKCEIACKTLLTLLRIHHNPIVADTSRLNLMEKLQNSAMQALEQFTDLAGVNLHGLLFLQRQMEAREGITLFQDATINFREKQKRKLRKEIVTKAAGMKL